MKKIIKFISFALTLVIFALIGCTATPQGDNRITASEYTLKKTQLNTNYFDRNFTLDKNEDYNAISDYTVTYNYEMLMEDEEEYNIIDENQEDVTLTLPMRSSVIRNNRLDVKRIGDDLFVTGRIIEEHLDSSALYFENYYYVGESYMYSEIFFQTGKDENGYYFVRKNIEKSNYWSGKSQYETYEYCYFESREDYIVQLVDYLYDIGTDSFDDITDLGYGDYDYRFTAIANGVQLTVEKYYIDVKPDYQLYNCETYNAKYLPDGIYTSSSMIYSDDQAKQSASVSINVEYGKASYENPGYKLYEYENNSYNLFRDYIIAE